MDPITAGLDLAGKFVDKFVKDKDLGTKLASEEYRMEFMGELQVMLAQIQVNLEEAKSGSLFKGGWRPAVGWSCAIAFMYNYILYPFLQFLSVLFMETAPEFPEVDLAGMMPVLLGMLGLVRKRTGWRQDDHC